MRLHEILENFADGKVKGKSVSSRVKNVLVQVAKDLPNQEKKRLGMHLENVLKCITGAPI